MSKFNVGDKCNCPDIAENLERSYVIRCSKEKAAQDIERFFSEMISECSGSDNGVDAVLDDYVIENILTPFKVYYIKQLTQK